MKSLWRLIFLFVIVLIFIYIYTYIYIYLYIRRPSSTLPHPGNGNTADVLQDTQEHQTPNNHP